MGVDVGAAADGRDREETAILWLREDLRLRDNPALLAAARTGLPVVPVFVEGWDDGSPWQPGAASRWWRARSLRRLAAALAELGLPLVLRRGTAQRVLREAVDELAATVVFADRLPSPVGEETQRRVAAVLAAGGRRLELADERHLFDWRSLDAGRKAPYRVFTPFWKACLRLDDPPRPTPAPRRVVSPRRTPAGLTPEALVEATRHRWARGFAELWEPGAAGARARLARFVAVALGGYAAQRDRPDLRGTSELSPHLHFGEVSVREVWWAARDAAEREGTAHDRLGIGEAAAPTETGTGDLRRRASEAPRRRPLGASEAFARQLVWREFAAYLLRSEPRLADEPLRPEFAAFPWVDDAEVGLTAWRTGRTGYPLVDAGMRALWKTGWVHNRVRLVCASFLVKHLLVPWQEGERWFWDTLVDADLADNAFGWQWVAGSGADAAPFFRIFNPVVQGERYDPEGAYVRRWVPELRELPARWVHRPWEAPTEVARSAGVVLGESYPRPIVPHAEARRRALAAFASLAR